MIFTVRVSRVSKKEDQPPKDQLFFFQTQAEAVAFMTGLRVRDGWSTKERYFAAYIDEGYKP